MPDMIDPPYKSAHRQLSVFERLTGRDSAGRFLPKWSGGTCDWWECEEPIEAPRRRFCSTHRRAHGQRLLEQLNAAEAGAAPDVDWDAMTDRQIADAYPGYGPADR